MTQEIKLEVGGYNFDKLDEELKAEITDGFHGLKQDKYGMWLVVADDFAPSSLAKALAISRAHAPEKKTAQQEKTDGIRAAAKSNIVHRDELIKALPDEKLREIISNLCARIEFLEHQIGIVHEAEKTIAPLKEENPLDSVKLMVAA